MLNQLFTGLFDTTMTSVISVSDFLLCLICALLAGLLLAVMYMYQNRYTKSFIATLAMLPAVVCVVIMMVNGNVGTGVAVAGAFSLVRFRSAPGSAREISALFLGMGTGLILGMGYIGYAFLFVLILGAVSMIYAKVDFGNGHVDDTEKTLRITIPEDLDYGTVFDDIFEKYTQTRELAAVKTTNMGSLYKLTYHVKLKDQQQEKTMIDQLRCRNGNLEISVSRQETEGIVL